MRNNLYYNLKKNSDVLSKSISYPEIISLLNYNLSYESNIKKTQKILVSLNDKIQKKLATKDLILYTKRSDIDKRIKVVGFKK